MKKVVWGTGLTAAKYVGTLKIDDVCFFIDSDKRKQGTVFMGRTVKMPDEIECWEQLQIYIQSDFYEEISKILKEKGLVEGKDFFGYIEPKQIIVEDIDADCEKVLAYIKKSKVELSGRNWYWGTTITDRVCKEYLNVVKNTLGQRFLAISDAVYFDQQESEKGWEVPVRVLPKIFAVDYFRIISEIKDDRDYKALLKKEYPELWENAKEYRTIYPQLAIGEECLYVYKQAAFIEKLINLLKPERVFVVCSFQPGHRILATLCNKYNIPVIYTHKGSLPKTWSFEIGGEMGESLPAIYADEFLKLSVNEVDIMKAKEVWEYLNTSKINRKIQPKTNWLDKTLIKIKKERPVIFYAGQNDVRSGLAYYGENAKKFHSPIFSSSIAALPFLAELAEKNSWNLIYKPHPMYMPTEKQIKAFPDNIIYVDYADINEIIDFADLTITILSSTAYVALIRKKPVLMLGYNQLKGKGCTYEAFTQDVIEGMIKQALEEGFTGYQKEAFSKHIAQMLKYYLYASLNDGTETYGRPIPKDFKEFYELAEILGVKKA